MLRSSVLARFLSLLAVLGAAASAAPPLTQIHDLLYKADGSAFTGSATISWRSFTASDTSNIPTNSITVQVVGGLLRVRLVPTTNAAGTAYYIVRFNADGKTQFTELWAVPPSAIPVAVKDIRIPSPPGSNVTPPPSVVLMADVSGLVEALADRPTKSIGFAPGRAAIIDAMGEMAAVSGAPSDCVRVDGTAGPCGLSGNTTPGFVDMETPAGAVNGVNTVFTLAQAPFPATSLHLYRNGILQRPAVDYLLSGNGVTFLTVATPQAGDLLSASYRTPPQ
ncbi:MAG: hypothetical protein HY858_16970 [Candidatus Solibacter usitatus]|nr:hypothetical protein [Candidatus Solibacter usitatus]